MRELPATETWETLYDHAEDFGKWQISSGKPTFEPRGAVLRGDGDGQIATQTAYRDFVLHLYIRGVRDHNGGVMFRSLPKSPAGPRQG